MSVVVRGVDAPVVSCVVVGDKLDAIRYWVQLPIFHYQFHSEGSLNGNGSEKNQGLQNNHLHQILQVLNRPHLLSTTPTSIIPTSNHTHIHHTNKRPHPHPSYQQTTPPTFSLPTNNHTHIYHTNKQPHPHPPYQQTTTSIVDFVNTQSYSSSSSYQSHAKYITFANGHTRRTWDHTFPSSIFPFFMSSNNLKDSSTGRSFQGLGGMFIPLISSYL